jgi:deoxyribodipyrimidine photo-lyase
MVSPRQIRAAAADAYRVAPDHDARESVNTWMDEIIWHEFYTHILWHFPDVIRHNFDRTYDSLPWRDAEDDFAAWAEGRTGYPVVDAAMRQLRATGWMHNRARMIVASFLTKDLLIDWRRGEAHFMQFLLDGDMAANNGGWQWAASTGTDAQPYFRIFNPVTQSERFDPDGTYIRRWVPELADVPTKHIHSPWDAKNPPSRYPPPIVDHSAARSRALDAFKGARS